MTWELALGVWERLILCFNPVRQIHAAFKKDAERRARRHEKVICATGTSESDRYRKDQWFSSHEELLTLVGPVSREKYYKFYFLATSSVGLYYRVHLHIQIFWLLLLLLETGFHCVTSLAVCPQTHRALCLPSVIKCVPHYAQAFIFNF